MCNAAHTYHLCGIIVRNIHFLNVLNYLLKSRVIEKGYATVSGHTLWLTGEYEGYAMLFLLITSTDILKFSEKRQVTPSTHSIHWKVWGDDIRGGVTGVRVNGGVKGVKIKIIQPSLL